MRTRPAAALSRVTHADPDAARRAPAKVRGPVTRFPGKVRIPFALGLTPALHATLRRTADRLGLKRGDVICELLLQYADKLQVAPAARG
jgi:hypothetical protein